MAKSVPRGAVPEVKLGVTATVGGVFGFPFATIGVFCAA
jgi:hypothetical protein